MEDVQGQRVTYDYAVAETIRVIDGDTVDLRIDAGFYMTLALRFRILNCDTPERHETGWAECTAYTTGWLAANAATLRAATIKTDHFGRWLADLYSGDNHLSDRLNELMAANGWTSPAVR